MATKTKSKGVVSKGERKNVGSKLLSGIRATKVGGQKEMDLQKAWLEGKNPWMTIANPNKNETNKRFIRVRANERFGDPKFRGSFKMGGQ